jgi:hypothetical protein
MADPAPPRRRFQFRLRTLLIVVTLVAAACWVIVDRQRLIGERDDALHRTQNQALTVEAFRKAAVNAIATQAQLEKAHRRTIQLERELDEQKSLSGAPATKP